MAAPTLEQIRRAPKVVLHDHLDGGLRPCTVIDLARDAGHQLPTTDPDALAAWFTEGAYRHNDLRWSDCERGNAAAHLRASLLGHGVAIGIAEDGTIVGNATLSGGGTRAFVFFPGASSAEFLDTKVPEPGLVIREALSITPGGAILVRGETKGKSEIFVVTGK